MNDRIQNIKFDVKPIKGRLKIELFDAETKKLVQKVEKENMVTNAVKNMLQAYAATNQMGEIMPLATVGLGGIMLFDTALTASADNVLFPSNSHLVGYGLQGVNTSNTMCGSKNALESSLKIGEDGRSVTVWDFGTSQANGTIRAVALTKNANPFRPLSAAAVAHPSYWNTDAFRVNYGTNAVLAYESGYAYVCHSITSSSEQSGSADNYTYTRTYTMTICKTYAPMKNYKVGDSPTNQLYTANEVHQTLTWTQTTSNIDPNFNDMAQLCVDFNGDGSAYIVWSPGNSSGDGELYVTKFENNSLNWAANTMQIVTCSGAQFLGGYHRIVDGYYYVVSFDRHSIYRIDMDNPTDIRQITLPEGYYVNGDNYWRTPSYTGVLFFTVYTDHTEGQQTVRHYYSAILYPDYTIVLDGASGTYIMDNVRLPFADGYAFGGIPGDNHGQSLEGRYLSNYLGTIANLQTPITKNASQTLKITYTLIDA